MKKSLLAIGEEVDLEEVDDDGLIIGKTNGIVINCFNMYDEDNKTNQLCYEILTDNDEFVIMPEESFRSK